MAWLSTRLEMDVTEKSNLRIPDFESSEKSLKLESRKKKEKEVIDLQWRAKSSHGNWSEGKNTLPNIYNEGLWSPHSFTMVAFEVNKQLTRGTHTRGDGGMVALQFVVCF